MPKMENRGSKIVLWIERTAERTVVFQSKIANALVDCGKDSVYVD